MFGPPGYKRGSWGHSLTPRESDDPLLDPEAEAEHEARACGYGRGGDDAAALRLAIANLERDAGADKFRHHFLRRAAWILRWRLGSAG